MIAARQQELLTAIDRCLRSGRPGVAQLLLNAVMSGLSTPCAAAIQARIYLADNAPARARAVVDAALAAIGRHNSVLLVARARAWLAEHQPSHALRDAAAATAATPSDPEAAGLYASLSMDNGAFATAAATLRHVIAHATVEAQIHSALVVALLCMGDIDAASRAVHAGLEAVPENVDLRRLAEKCRVRRDAARIRIESPAPRIAVSA